MHNETNNSKTRDMKHAFTKIDHTQMYQIIVLRMFGTVIFKNKIAMNELASTSTCIEKLAKYLKKRYQ
jgi:hypothetical protein